jgi:hypothetical protein
MPARATSPNKNVTSLFNMGPLIVGTDPTGVKEAESSVLNSASRRN